MRLVKQSAARNVLVFITQAADHVTGLTGATLTITASKDGGAFASISPTVTERGSGWYSIALTASHTDTAGDLALHVTAASADPTDTLMQVVAFDPADATALGLSRLDADVSSRLATAGYTAPDNAGIAAAAAGVSAVETDTQDIQARLPAALVGGRIDANVGAVNGYAVTGQGTEADPWGP